MSEGEPTGGDDVFRFYYGDDVKAKTGFYSKWRGRVLGATDDGEQYDVAFGMRSDVCELHSVTVRFNWYEIDA